MQTLRGIYDGKTIRPAPGETLPEVQHEIPVLIQFDDDTPDEIMLQQRQEALACLHTLRDKMLPLDVTIREMIEDGRSR